MKQTLDSSGARKTSSAVPWGNGLWTAYGKVRVLQGGVGLGCVSVMGPQFPTLTPASPSHWLVAGYRGAVPRSDHNPQTLLIFTWVLKLLGSTFDSSLSLLKGEAQSCPCGPWPPAWREPAPWRGWAAGRLPAGSEMGCRGSESCLQEAETLAPPGACQTLARRPRKAVLFTS